METENRANYWPQIVLLLAAAANFMQFREPLRSSRPAPAVVSERRVMAEADVEARLWQDPFEAVAATEARANSKKPPVALNEAVDPRYSLDGLVAQMQRFAESDTAENQVTVLAVMVPGDTYTEAVETRLKARYAVLAGLVESGIAPENSELIGRCYLPWNRSGSLHPEFKSKPMKPHPLFAGFIGAALEQGGRRTRGGERS